MGCLKFGHIKKDCDAPIIPGQPMYPYFNEISEVVTIQQDKILNNVGANIKAGTKAPEIHKQK
jgi:hypothetical protein